MAKQTTSTPQTATQQRAARPKPAGAKPVIADAARRRNAPNILTFFQESRAELRKVTWPTRQEAMNLTLAVIAMTVAIAVFLGVIDAALDQLVKPVLG